MTADEYLQLRKADEEGRTTATYATLCYQDIELIVDLVVDRIRELQYATE